MESFACWYMQPACHKEESQNYSYSYFASSLNLKDLVCAQWYASMVSVDCKSIYHQNMTHEFTILSLPHRGEGEISKYALKELGENTGLSRKPKIVICKVQEHKCLPTS